VENGRTHGENGGPEVLDTHRRHTARGRRRGLAAVAGAVLGLLLAPPGCLNPRPEEDPSYGGNGDFAPPVPQSQTCEDNPTLAGCGRTPDDISDGNGVDDADEETSPGNPTEGPASEAPAAPPSPEDAGVTLDAGSDGGDAGVDP
jgi:hypothetical protein